MLQFEENCSEIGVPIANEKTEGPSTIIEYLGLTIDTVNMLIKIPEKKVQDLLKKIKLLSYRKKVTLKELQSICGSLAFVQRDCLQVALLVVVCIWLLSRLQNHIILLE